MKPKYRIPRGFTLVELLVVIVIIASLAGLTAPMVMKQVRKGDHTQAISNARQIGVALFEFENSYGNFPDDDTAIAVKDATDTNIVSGQSANDRFRQILRANIADSEEMFYAKAPYTKKPDKITNTDEKALGKGEVGFGMIVNADNTGLSSSGNTSRPIVVAPFTAPCNKPEFDSDAYLGQSVVLKADRSVEAFQIVPTSKKIKIGGKDITQDGQDTVWGASNPVKFAYPEPKGGGGGGGGGGGTTAPTEATPDP